MPAREKRPLAARAVPKAPAAVRPERRNLRPAVRSPAALEFANISVEHREPAARGARVARARPSPPPRRARASPPLRAPAARSVRRRNGVPGGPSPPAPRQDDPATLVESARKRDARSAPPSIALFAARLGRSLSGLEVYRGAAARRACERLRARALCAGNVLLFRDDVPALALVAHELAHVFQQRADRSRAAAFSPGALAVAAAASRAERDADAFAGGTCGAADLQRAPIALYRAEVPSGLDETNLEEEEQRFKEFLLETGKKSSKWAKFGLHERSPPVFRREKDAEEGTGGRYKRSSGEKFAFADYNEVVKNGHDGELRKILASGEKWRLSQVGGEDARKYAVTGSGEYQPIIYEIEVDRKGPTPEENAASLRDYRASCGKITNTKIRNWAKNKWTQEVTAHVKNLSAVTDDELSKARDVMEAKIVDVYEDDVDGLFKDVVKTAAFPKPYTRIQGNIFEKWVAKNRPGIDAKAGQPVFKDKTLTKERYGDLVVKEGTDFIIGEVKAVTTGPKDTQIAQMKDYLRILSRKPPIQGYVKDPKDPDGVKGLTFIRVRYYFGPDTKIAGLWMKELLVVFRKRTDLFETDPPLPKTQPKKKVQQGIKKNPVIAVTVDDADDAANLTHKLVDPPITHPGLKLKEYEVTLRTPGYAPIESGSFTMLLDAKGAPLTAEPTPKKFQPVPASDPATPAAPAPANAPQIVGTIDGGLDKPQPGGLDKFLKKVHAKVDLSDDGLTGSIWVDPGEKIAKDIRIDKAQIDAGLTKSRGFFAKGEVAVSYQPDPDKFKGSVTVEYAKGKWKIEGKATVAKLIEGLDPFDVSIKHENDLTTIAADKLKLRKKVAGIDLEGGVDHLAYDVETGGFSAQNINFKVDLGLFGSATATADIANSELQRLRFDYESKTLQYPPKSKSPLVSGTLKGSLLYEKGKYSGDIGGTAYLKIPALEKISKGLGDTGFVIAVHIDERGRYSGSIALAEDKPIQLGKYLRIPQLKLALDEEGALSSEFTIEVTENLKFVKEARISCAITKEGRFEILQASARVKVGDETKDRVAAELGLDYDKKLAALVVTGTVWIRIKEGMVAKGVLTWNSATNEVSGRLSIDRIQLLKWSGHKKFIDLKKQITLFMIYVLGIYLDVRFELSFNYSFELGLTPSIELQGLSLDDWSWKLAIATVKLDGLLKAELVGKPGIGLGLFAIHPKVVRGGGGLALPISALATVDPSGTVQIRYKPDGSLEGGGRVGLTLTFGIKAALKPYAEFSVLDGLYEPTWEGDALAEFVILEERELFTYYIDFGAGLQKEEGEPKLPSGDGGKGPPAQAGDEKKRIRTTRPAPKAEEPEHGKRDQDPPEKKKTEDAKKEGGFDFKTMIGQLLNSPKFAPIKKVLDAAADTWEAITGAFKAIYNFFKKWFDVIREGIEALVDAIRTIAKEGLIAYFKKLLKRKLGAFYDIIAPLFDALEKVAGKFEDLLAKLMDDPIPLTPVAFLKWTLSTVAAIFGIAVSAIGAFVKALVKVVDNAKNAFLDFVNYLIQNGQLGVRRYVYYVPRPIVKNIYFYAPTEYKIHFWGMDIEEKVDGDLIGLSDALHPSRIVHKAIAFLLWEFFESSSRIHSTGGWNDPDVDDDTRKDYWK